MVKYSDSAMSWKKVLAVTPGQPGTLSHRAQSGQGFFKMPAIRTICA